MYTHDMTKSSGDYRRSKQLLLKKKTTDPAATFQSEEIQMIKLRMCNEFGWAVS